MGQATLDEDDLFGEAADELEADVRKGIDAASAALPDADTIWAANADNILGVLNGLKGSLDTGDARESLRDAQKWFTIGQRAGAFEQDGELATELEALNETITAIESAEERVSELINTLPELKQQLS